MAFGDVAKEISKRWAELSEAEKAPFNAQAEADKARYEDQMQSYTPANPTKKVGCRVLLTKLISPVTRPLQPTSRSAPSRLTSTSGRCCD